MKEAIGILLKKKIPICVYVTTRYLHNVSYMPFYPPWSDNLFFKTQCTIINFFRNRKDCLLIWKLHPSLKLCDRPPPIEKGADNIYVEDKGQFIDLLDVADFFVIDCPLTTVLQALTTKKPIFCVMKHIKYLPEALELLKKRAVCCEEPEDLMKEVEVFLG